MNNNNNNEKSKIFGTQFRDSATSRIPEGVSIRVEKKFFRSTVNVFIFPSRARTHAKRIKA